MTEETNHEPAMSEDEFMKVMDEASVKMLECSAAYCNEVSPAFNRNAEKVLAALASQLVACMMQSVQSATVAGTPPEARAQLCADVLRDNCEIFLDKYVKMKNEKLAEYPDEMPAAVKDICVALGVTPGNVRCATIPNDETETEH